MHSHVNANHFCKRFKKRQNFYVWPSLIVRRHLTLTVTSTTRSPWPRSGTRACTRGWGRAAGRGRARPSTTLTTSGCRWCCSYRQGTLRLILWLCTLIFRQRHFTCPTFSTSLPTTIEYPIWFKTCKTLSHSMKSEMTSLVTSTFICRSAESIISMETRDDLKQTHYPSNNLC